MIDITYNRTRLRRRTYSIAKHVKLFLFVLLVTITMLGCDEQIQSQVQVIQVGTLKVEKPSTWEIKYHERNGIAEMNTVYSNDSAYLWFALGPYDVEGSNTITDAMEFEIDRLFWVYNLDSNPVVQREFNGNDIYTATAVIPTLNISNSIGNQVGIQSQDVYQPIELYIFKCESFFVRAAIHKGNNDELNTEAITIIESIKSLNCYSKFQE